jgi:hypothetical protein
LTSVDPQGSGQLEVKPYTKRAKLQLSPVSANLSLEGAGIACILPMMRSSHTKLEETTKAIFKEQACREEELQIVSGHLLSRDDHFRFIEELTTASMIPHLSNLLNRLNLRIYIRSIRHSILWSIPSHYPYHQYTIIP